MVLTRVNSSLNRPGSPHARLEPGGTENSDVVLLEVARGVVRKVELSAAGVRRLDSRVPAGDAGPQVEEDAAGGCAVRFVERLAGMGVFGVDAQLPVHGADRDARLDEELPAAPEWLLPAGAQLRLQEPQRHVAVADEHRTAVGDE